MPKRMLVPYLALCLLPATAYAEGARKPSVTRIAQEQETVQKDVPFVPTREETVARMLGIAGVTKDDVVYDLGSGDGRIVVMAAQKLGARAVGVEIDPVRIQEANNNAKAAGVTNRVEFRQQSLFDADIKDATVVTIYLLPSVNLRIRNKLLTELKPGARIVSHDFDMGDWRPDRKEKVGDDTVYLWVVPASVQGTYRLSVPTAEGEAPATLTLEQKFQDVSGSLKLGNRRLPLAEVTLQGDAISFRTAEGSELTFRGRVQGTRIQGNVTPAGGQSRAFTAQREGANP
ncbi:class I SAM-dependent methyltransferase [Polyangium sp. y55x31]|uniref:SAM-dependent methyltransferase n=1 Tax=Polyangium sp. y55x31 TaxID=3042688 RepID=UPI002482579A|nr:class I SAM-dependent methyltransferase [Polyangium sp. y55x31]MDI1483494.1 class I SAM-dependent methyltransferase [Polyangium sp. y55x31]